MMHEIGSTAGPVWEFLKENPNSNLEQINKGVAVGNGLVYLSLGWLAREDKLVFEGKGKQAKFSLKD